MTKKAPVLFLDFDGTISDRDAIDAILERFADERWLAIEDEWRMGRIGSRECLTRQVALVSASAPELEELLAEIKVDEGFGALLEVCARHNVPAHIVSDGFDFCIERILANASREDCELARMISKMRVCSSRLRPSGERNWEASFPFFAQTCAHNCATCKPAVMRLLNPHDATTVFVGDGLSDRYAAECADLVFAKKSLAKFCAEQGVEFIAYETLGDVAAQFDEMLRAGCFDALAAARGGALVGA